MKLLGLPDMLRAIADAYTAWKQGKGPAAADKFNQEAQRAHNAAVVRDASAIERALRRKRVLRAVETGKDKPPPRATGKPKPGRPR